MNDVQNLIDRQLGIVTRFNYDNVLKRLMVLEEESYYGLQAGGAGAALLDQDPPIFACRFAEAAGYENILALANEDGRVAIQDTSKVGAGTSLEGFSCHNNAVFDLAWKPGDMNFVTVSGDHTASLWDVAEGAPKRVMVFSHHTKSVKTVVFRPTEPSVFATGARDGDILLWDIRANNQPSVVLKPDNRLANCHSSFTPKTPASHSKRPRIDTQRAVSITGLVFQDDNTLLSCGECDGNIKVWDLRKNYNIYKREPLPKHSIPYCGSSTKNGYTNLIIDDARTRLYASCMDNVIYCFNISTYNALPVQRYVGHENRTFYIKTSLSADCAYLVSGSSDRHAYVWNVRYSQPVVRLAGHAAEVTCAAFRRAPPLALVTCSDDARHYVWRLGPESPPAGARRAARAEPAPRPDPACAPHWRVTTPTSLKRRLTTTPTSHSSRRSKPQDVRKTKRCLVDLMNQREDTEIPSKKIKTDLSSVAELEEPKLLPAGTKRHIDAVDPTSPVKKNCMSDDCDWTYIPRAGSSFMTPTKNYERRSCKILSPKSPRTISPGRSPSKSPKVKATPFGTPTKNLPNFVLDGEAPHQRLMSPPRKRSADWLTLMLREKKGRSAEGEGSAAPPGPKEAPPPRRNSVTEKTPKSNKKSRTLLKYFSVTSIEKS